MALVPTCAGVLSVGGGGEVLCSVAWTFVEQSDLGPTTWTLTDAGAAEISAAAAVIFVTAWGLNLVVRSVLNLR